MELEIMRDPRVRGVEWRDLVPVSRGEVVKELCLPMPWLAGSLFLSWLALRWPFLLLPALALSFVFFLTGLRVVHNAHHYALGLPRRATEWVMFAMSVLMLGSMHAVQRNHLHHHKHCMDDGDMEGYSARLSAWQALLYGPVFPVRLHLHAFRLGRRRHRVWILSELAANVLWLWLVFGVFGIFALKYHVAVMAVGQCMTAFFAVWTVHHDCDRSQLIARTLRGRLKNRVSFEMFFHLEHHLFPKVPTCHLPALAERLDRAAPELQAHQVF